MRFFKKITKQKFLKCANGSIAILMSFILTGILSVASLIVETIRYEEALQQLEESTINSALSILAYYDSDLADRFGLYGMDSESDSLTKETFLEYLMFNSDETDTGVYAGTELAQLYNVSSGTYELGYDLANYQVLKRQILEYEKYRGPINIAEDVLDTDEMLKKLKKNIEKAIPGLEEMLKICDSVSDIVDAVKKLYCLYKDVEQLQLTINSGGEEGAGEHINAIIGEGWELVENWFSGEEWPSHDPSYITAYNSFKTAVENKVQYMKDNQKPEDPGAKPTADVLALLQDYENAKSNYEQIEYLEILLLRAKELQYCNQEGIIQTDERISDIFNKDITEEELLLYSLDKNSNRITFFDTINSYIGSLLGADYVMENYSLTSVETALGTLNTKLKELKNSVSEKDQTYQKANMELRVWTAKNDALTTYNNSISTYDDEITSARDTLVEVIGVVAGELDSYKSSLTAISSSFDKAADALETIKEVNAGNHVISESEGENIFSKLQEEYITKEENKPIQGLAFLYEQKQKLEGLKTEDITESYVFSKNFSTGDLLHDSGYYMTKGVATIFCSEIAGYNLFENLTEFTSIFTAMWELVNVLQPLPCMFSWDCKVELNSSTTDILPSKINDESGTFSSFNATDISEITQELNSASSLLGNVYDSDINLVDPNVRIEEAEFTQEVSDRITRLSNNLSAFVINTKVGSLMSAPVAVFIVVIVQFYEIVTTLVEIVEDIIFVCKNFEKVIEVVLSSLGNNILLNQYAIDMFPNRTTKNNSDISGYAGAERTWTPDNTLPVQTFSGAHVEYIIGGSNSEISNQIACFWRIFVIRVIDNIAAILMDVGAMEIISACNIFAPLVFILWLYLESNIDTNLLISGQEVPLIKTEIFLSPTIKKDGDDWTVFVKELEDLKVIFKDIDKNGKLEDEWSYAALKIEYLKKEFFDIGGEFKMEYKDYLWFFMLLIPSETKVMRMADLIQMEMRYKKLKTGDDFQLKNVYTYVRCESKATLNTILPVVSLGDNQFNGKIMLRSVKYVGY